MSMVNREKALKFYALVQELLMDMEVVDLEEQALRDYIVDVVLDAEIEFIKTFKIVEEVAEKGEKR